MIYLTKYVVLTGEIRGYVGVREESEITPNVFMLDEGQAMIDGEWDAGTHYILNDEPVERPSINIPEIYALGIGVDWALPDVPVGTAVLIDGDEAGVVDETGLVLNFIDPGTWAVALKPPFPWIENSCEVVVS